MNVSAAEPPEERAAEKAEERAAEKAADKAAEQAAEKAAEKATEQAAEKAAEKATEQAAEKATEKATEQAAEKAEERSSDRMETQATEQAEERTMEQYSDRMEAGEYDAEDRMGDFETEDRNGHFDMEDDSEKKEYSDMEHGPGDDNSAGVMVERLREFRKIDDSDGFEAVSGEILVLLEENTRLDMTKDNFQVKGRQYLPGLDMVLIRIVASEDKKISDTVSDISGAIDEGDVDLNHLFLPETQNTDIQDMPHIMANFTNKLNLDIQNSALINIGLIDTLVDHTHPALQHENIKIADFVPYDRIRPKTHGTAVASILIGNETDKYRGLTPGAKLHAASVFFKVASGKVAATTESLILALDWLVQEKVQVINMSLSGPANRLLEIAVNKVAEKGIIIVAAVGNAGPAAAPLYPAAYGSVIAVTAVDNNQRVYLRANRGQHVIFSAPGVNIPTANAAGGYQTRTGTSIAVPFVTAILADMISNMATTDKSGKSGKIITILEKNTLDLGKKGFDDTYGYGLIQAISP